MYSEKVKLHERQKKFKAGHLRALAVERAPAVDFVIGPAKVFAH
jgi:hypothetical protein